MDEKYIFKLWGVTLGLSPLLFFGLQITDYQGIPLALGYILFSFIVGIIFSLPTMSIVSLSFTFLSKLIESVSLMKVLLAIISIFGIVISFRLMGGELSIPLPWYYSGVVVLGSFVIRLEQKE